MENEYLKPALDAEMCRQIRNATNSTPRYVVLGRVVETVCQYIHLPLNSLPDYKNCIHLDAELKRAIQEYWHLQSLSNDSAEELEKIVSKDYHKPIDVIRFVGLLSKRESKQSQSNVKKLYEILAVDGYLGEDVKRYVEYLKLASWDPVKAIHVNAVRQMYRDHGIDSPRQMHHVLEMTFGLKPCETNEELEARNAYTNLVRDALDAITEWKMNQSREESKRKDCGTGKKRKLEPVEGSKMTHAPKRGRKNKNPVKIETRNEEEKNDESGSSSSSEDELEQAQE